MFCVFLLVNFDPFCVFLFSKVLLLMIDGSQSAIISLAFIFQSSDVIESAVIFSNSFSYVSFSKLSANISRFCLRQGNPRKSWILDSTTWILDSTTWIPDSTSWILDSITWILDSTTWIQGARLIQDCLKVTSHQDCLSLKLGFLITINSKILDSLIYIPHSKAQDFGIHKQIFSGFWNPDSLT